MVGLYTAVIEILNMKVNGYVLVLEHVVIFEYYHRCCILPWAVIHHINGIRDDNRIENLEGMLRSKHTVLHKKLKLEDRTCFSCNRSHRSRGWYRLDPLIPIFDCRSCHDIKYRHDIWRRTKPLLTRKQRTNKVY